MDRRLNQQNEIHYIAICLQGNMKSIDITEKGEWKQWDWRCPLCGDSDTNTRPDNVFPGFTQELSWDSTFWQFYTDILSNASWYIQ